MNNIVNDRRLRDGDMPVDRRRKRIVNRNDSGGLDDNKMNLGDSSETLHLFFL